MTTCKTSQVAGGSKSQPALAVGVISSLRLVIKKVMSQSRTGHP